MGALSLRGALSPDPLLPDSLAQHRLHSTSTQKNIAAHSWRLLGTLEGVASTYLDEIMAWHRANAPGGAVDASLLAAARACGRAPSLGESLSGCFGVIAEFKRRSPSKGKLTLEERSPQAVARAYQSGGASGLSVLTDEVFFGAARDDLEEIARVVSVPVLRKDFLVSAAEVVASRVRGASAVLVIAAALAPGEAEELIAAAREAGLEVLLEVHRAQELDGIDLYGCDFAGAIGVNQRDLVTFEVDRARAEAVVADLPTGWPRVAESGIAGPEDVARLAAAGFDGVLVGEALMRSADAEAAVAEMVEAGRRVRQDLRNHQPG